MSKLLDKAKELLTRHDDKVDKGLDKAAEQADQRTGPQHTEHVEKGAQAAKDRTGGGDTTR